MHERAGRNISRIERLRRHALQSTPHYINITLCNRQIDFQDWLFLLTFCPHMHVEQDGVETMTITCEFASRCSC